MRLSQNLFFVQFWLWLGPVRPAAGPPPFGRPWAFLPARAPCPASGALRVLLRSGRSANRRRGGGFVRCWSNVSPNRAASSPPLPRPCPSPGWCAVLRLALRPLRPPPRSASLCSGRGWARAKPRLGAARRPMGGLLTASRPPALSPLQPSLKERISHGVNGRDAGATVIEIPAYTLKIPVFLHELDRINLPRRVGPHVLRHSKGPGGPFNVLPDGLPSFMPFAVPARKCPFLARLGPNLSQQGFRQTVPSPLPCLLLRVPPGRLQVLSLQSKDV